MVILTPENVNMQSDAGCKGERLEYMREHFRREVSDLLALHIEVRDAEWAPRDVNDCSRECL